MPEQTFVARHAQLAELNKRLDLALEGQTQFAFVVGEAGSGKTALLQHFVRVAQEEHPALIMTHGNCNAQTGISDPYLPFREILNLLVGIEDVNLSAGSLTRENGKRISNLLVDSGRILLEIGPDLIGSFVPGGALLSALGRAVIVKKRTAERLDEIQKKQQSGLDANAGIVEQSQVFEQYTKTLQAIAEKHPLVIIVDDLHWTDKASASLLFHLVRRIQDSPVLIIGTYRPVEVATGSGNGNAHPLANVITEMDRLLGESTLDLDHLEESEKREFFNQLIDAEPNQLGDEFRTRFYEVTGGHPLFTVELLRHMQAQRDLQKDENDYWVASQNLDWNSLPVRIDGVIKGRVQRLDKESKEILSAASLQGGQFVAEVVAGVLDIKVGVVISKLSGELSVTQKLVRPRSSEKIAGKRVSVYEFQHNLFQQYFLANVDVVQKPYMHEETGNQLELIYESQLDEIAPQLAYHFSEGDEAEKAIQYANIAGDRARLAFASSEAISHYQIALKHLLELENFAEAARINMKLAQSFQNISDYQATTKAYEAAFALRKKATKQLPAERKPAERAYRTIWHEVDSLDPGLAGDDISTGVIVQLFSGLVDIDTDGVVIPNGAQKWEILDDGRRYHFHLRKDVFWSDGIPVTAHDYMLALRRLFSPEIRLAHDSEIAHFIKGWDLVTAGKDIDTDDIGVKALQDYLLEIELEIPIAFFLQCLGNVDCFPVPQHIFEKYGSDWISIDHIVSNGPFTLKDYKAGEFYLLEKNERYHLPFEGNLGSVELQIVAESDLVTGIELYANGEIDSVYSLYIEPVKLMTKFGADVINIAEEAIYGLHFDVANAPFNDVRVRKAFSLVIDVVNFVGRLEGASRLPANGGMVPPGVPGHIADSGIKPDIELARQLLIEAGFPEGKDFPAQSLTVSDGRVSEGQLLCEYWKEFLNIELKLTSVPFPEFLEGTRKHAYDVWISGWVSSYPDPDPFLYGSAWLEQSGWNSEEYIELVQKARVTIDQKERLALYRKAEEVIREEVPVKPLFYGSIRYFAKAHVQNFQLVPRQTMPLFRDLILKLDSEDQGL